MFLMYMCVCMLLPTQDHGEVYQEAMQGAWSLPDAGVERCPLFALQR